MMDTLNIAQRSERMRRVMGKNTAPELVVRRLIFALGFRYRLHAKHMPGKPDIVFCKHRKLIFVHGCFWHRHSAKSCRLARLPKSHQKFWIDKLESNRLRDQRNIKMLKARGWKILVVWECQLKHKERIKNKLASFLEG